MNKFKEILLAIKEFATDQLPMILVILLLCNISILLLFKHVPAIAPKPAIVVFDAIKLSNSQKKFVSSKSLTTDSELVATLASMKNLVNSTIKEVAPANSIIIIKQALVVPDDSVIDITDAVLIKLGLPVNVTSQLLDTSISPEKYLNVNKELITEKPNTQGLTNKDWLP